MHQIGAERRHPGFGADRHPWQDTDAEVEIAIDDASGGQHIGLQPDGIIGGAGRNQRAIHLQRTLLGDALAMRADLCDGACDGAVADRQREDVAAERVRRGHRYKRCPVIQLHRPAGLGSACQIMITEALPRGKRDIGNVERIAIAASCQRCVEGDSTEQVPVGNLECPADMIERGAERNRVAWQIHRRSADVRYSVQKLSCEAEPGCGAHISIGQTRTDFPFEYRGAEQSAGDRASCNARPLSRFGGQRSVTAPAPCQLHEWNVRAGPDRQCLTNGIELHRYIDGGGNQIEAQVVQASLFMDCSRIERRHYRVALQGLLSECNAERSADRRLTGQSFSIGGKRIWNAEIIAEVCKREIEGIAAHTSQKIVGADRGDFDKKDDLLQPCRHRLPGLRRKRKRKKQECEYGRRIVHQLLVVTHK